MRKASLLLLVIALLLTAPLFGQCDDQSTAARPAAVPELTPRVKLDPSIVRLLKYAVIESRHRLTGLASYYSRSLDGTLTANGEHYHANRFSAAHLTLPLGCWVEIRARATGKRIRLRVNDRGPYVNKFVIDLSRKAARALGVDVAEDRTVSIRIIALPGEDPLDEEMLQGPESVVAEGTVSSR